MLDINEKIKEFTNTKDTTEEFDNDDIEQNKLIAALSYLSWLLLVPLFLAPKSKFARYHCNQGMVLAIIEVIAWVLFGTLGSIPFVGWIFKIVDAIVTLACIFMAIIGLINVAGGKAKELPIIGNIIVIK